MDVLFHWVGGATCIITIGKLKLAIDPVLCSKGSVQDYFWFKSERLEDPCFTEGDFEAVDLWLITHDHEDHLDGFGISKISNSAAIVSNRNGAKKLSKSGLTSVNVLRPNQKKTFHLHGYSVEVEAISAVHGINPVSAFFAGKGNGYYVTVTKKSETARIYFTGDTVYRKKVMSAFEKKPVDILVPNMGAAQQGSWIMTLTLTAKMLRKMIDKIDPANVVPVHYGTFAHYREPKQAIEDLADNRIVCLAPGDKTAFFT